MATCIVSYNDLHGRKHRTQVEADSLFEAAALAALEFAKGGSAPGIATVIEVEVKPTRHKVTMAKVHEFSQRHGKSPRDQLLRKRLRNLIDAVQKVR